MSGGSATGAGGDPTAPPSGRQLAPGPGVPVRFAGPVVDPVDDPVVDPVVDPGSGQGGGAEAGVTVGARARPPGPARAAVLLLPGYTGSKEDFAPLMAPLVAAGFDVVALDLPGQRGAPGPDDPSAYTPDALAERVVLVAGTLRSEQPEVPVHLLGHSYGGLVARAAVLAAPAAFDSLVLLGSGPAAIGGGRRALIDAIEPVLAAGGRAAAYAATVEIARRDPRWRPSPPALEAFFADRFVTTSLACLEGIGRAIRDEPDRTADLAAVGLRTLLVCGAGDDAWPVALQRATADRLSATFAVVGNADHSPAVENPAGLLEVLLPFWR